MVSIEKCNWHGYSITRCEETNLCDCLWTVGVTFHEKWRHFSQITTQPPTIRMFPHNNRDRFWELFIHWNGREYGEGGENIYLAILMNHDEMSDGDFFKRLFFLLIVGASAGQDILQFGGRRKGCPNKYGKQGGGHTQGEAGYWPFSVSTRRGRSPSSSGHKILFCLNSIAVYGVKGKFRPTNVWNNKCGTGCAVPLQWLFFP